MVRCFPHPSFATPRSRADRLGGREPPTWSNPPAELEHPGRFQGARHCLFYGMSGRDACRAPTLQPSAASPSLFIPVSECIFEVTRVPENRRSHTCSCDCSTTRGPTRSGGWRHPGYIPLRCDPAWGLSSSNRGCSTRVFDRTSSLPGIPQRTKNCSRGWTPWAWAPGCTSVAGSWHRWVSVVGLSQAGRRNDSRWLGPSSPIFRYSFLMNQPRALIRLVLALCCATWCGRPNGPVAPSLSSRTPHWSRGLLTATLRSLKVV